MGPKTTLSFRCGLSVETSRSGVPTEATDATIVPPRLHRTSHPNQLEYRFRKSGKSMKLNWQKASAGNPVVSVVMMLANNSAAPLSLHAQPSNLHYHNPRRYHACSICRG